MKGTGYEVSRGCGLHLSVVQPGCTREACAGASGRASRTACALARGQTFCWCPVLDGEGRSCGEHSPVHTPRALTLWEAATPLPRVAVRVVLLPAVCEQSRFPPSLARTWNA